MKHAAEERTTPGIEVIECRHGTSGRREALGSALAATLSLAGRSSLRAEDSGTFGLVVKETAGLRRFSYPVHTVLPGGLAGRSFRLLREGRVVPAQFRSMPGADGRPVVALDFTSSLGPLESERYLVEARPVLELGPYPKRGVLVEETDAAFRVRSGTALTYTVGAGLQGFLDSVVNGGREYVEPRSGGLFLRTRQSDAGHAVRLGGEDARGIRGAITRQGPLAAGLRFEGTTVVPGSAPVPASLELTFPSSKSWVEARWRVDDPVGVVAGLYVDLRLKLAGPTTLVDLGTAATIYGVLRGREMMTLTAGSAAGFPTATRPGWSRGSPEAMIIFAEAPAPDAPLAEGWAHVMDAERCTALAVAGFGRGTRDRIAIEPDGRVRIARDFAGGPTAPPPGPKVLQFWFHFVPIPVQIGAATSPQAMLAPLEVGWDDSRR